MVLNGGIIKMIEHKEIVRDVHGLIKKLKSKPKEIILCKSLYEWFLKSNWDCLLSDELKQYIKNGGSVIKYL